MEIGQICLRNGAVRGLVFWLYRLYILEWRQIDATLLSPNVTSFVLSLEFL